MDKLKLTILDGVLYNLLALNMDTRERVPVDYSDVRHLRDYATVSFDPGMRSGKTVWLYNIATSDDVIICQHPLDLPCEAKVMRPAEVSNAPPGTLTSQPMVYIDAASTYSRQELDTFYRRYASEGVTFILVG